MLFPLAVQMSVLLDDDLVQSLFFTHFLLEIVELQAGLDGAS